MGYRYFDKEGRLVAFPFGHGLSYTTFLYGRPRLSSPSLSPDGSVTVSMDVTNTGSRAGDEVVQLYVHDPMPKVDKAPRELKGFARVSLQPGEKKTVTIELRPRALAYCDVADKQWKADAGNYDIEIGASSRDIRQRVVLKLDATFTEAIPFMQEQWIPDTQPASQEADGAKK